MRLSPLLLAFALTASAVSVANDARAQQAPIDPVSAALVADGRGALEAGDLVAADNAFETALVADPRNVAAYVAMAEVAIAQNLYGQAIRQTRKGLNIDPTDRAALAVQGEAFAALGAEERARDNAQKLVRICGEDCAERADILAALERGPVLAAKQPDEDSAAN